MKLALSVVVAVLLASAHAWQGSRFMGTQNVPMTTTTTSGRVKSSTLLRMASDDNAPPLKRNPPRKVCLMVEPTPFTHVSGYSNRFKEMLKFMKKAGDEFEILTVDSKTPAKDLPDKIFDYRISHTQGFTFPLYNHISLTFDLPEMKGARILEKFKPDLIHTTSP